MDISVIIPVYKLHHQFLAQAISSVDFKAGDYEIIVVNDSPDAPLNAIDIKVNSVINRTHAEPKWGAGGGRNRGAAVATGDLLLFLDADDKLIFGAMDRMWHAFQKILKTTGERHIIYGDLIHGATGQCYKTPPPYRGNDINRAPILPENSVRPYLCLMPREHFEAVGGYPPEDVIDTYEELVLEADQWVANIPQTHIDVVTYDYRWWQDSRRTLALTNTDSEKPIIRPDIIEFFKERYKDCIMQTKACGSCGQKPKVVNTGNFTARNSPRLRSLPKASYDEDQYLIYTGVRETKRVTGPATQLKYKFGKIKRLAERLVVDKPVEQVDPNREIHIEDAKVLYATMYMNSNEFNERRVVVDRPAPVETKTTDNVVEQPKPGSFDPNLIDAVLAEATANDAPTGNVTADFDGLKLPLTLVSDWTIEKIVEYLPELNEFDIGQLLAFEKAKSTPRKTLIATLEKSLDETT